MTSHQNTKKESKESLVGAYRAESTFDFSAGSGITPKIPPLFDGSTSWFNYEELIEDWLDLAVLDETKRRQALKNRLVGDAEMYKGLLNRECLRATDGDKYFRNTLTPGVPLEILSVQSSKKRKFRNGQVDRQVFTALSEEQRRNSVSCRRGPRKC